MAYYIRNAMVHIFVFHLVFHTQLEKQKTELMRIPCAGISIFPKDLPSCRAANRRLFTARYNANSKSKTHNTHKILNAMADMAAAKKQQEETMVGLTVCAKPPF